LKRNSLLTALAIGAMAVGTQVNAQDADAPAPPPEPPVGPVAVPPLETVDPGYAPAVRMPGNGFSFMHHSSTAAEGYLRGAGAYVRALGAANLDNSLANMNNQEALRRSLENTLKYAETYYARRDLWFDYREEHRRKPLTMEGYKRLAAEAGADRLTNEEFDANTGKVNWPALLQAKVLKPYREGVDEALNNRSITENGIGSRTYEVVRANTAAMQDIIDRYREDVPTYLYVDATKFLESVLFESRFAPPGAAPAEDTALAP
jgi:hypothetical protein